MKNSVPITCRFVLSVLMLMVSGFSISAPVGIYDGAILVGAKGIKYGGSSYDVAFHDTSCELLFAGCDQLSDLDFQWEEGRVLATALNTILFSQVLEMNPVVDANPNNIFGCSSRELCQIVTPVYTNTNGPTNGTSVIIYNYGPERFDQSPAYEGIGFGSTPYIGPFPGSVATNYGDVSYAVYAKWTLVSSVSEPESIHIVLAGMLLIMLSFRLKGGINEARLSRLLQIARPRWNDNYL